MSITITAVARVRYVDAAGDDANDGSSLGLAWRTIAKANAMLTAGDTVYILSGVYTDQINPVNSGTPGHPLAYINHEAEICSLYVNDCAVSLVNKSYIIVQGLRIQMAFPVNQHVVTVSGGAHNAILNCRIYGGSSHNNAAWGDWPSIYFTNTSYNRFIGNFFDRQDEDITDDLYRGDGVALYGNSSRYNVFEGNTIVNVSHYGLSVPYGVQGESMNIVRNNRIYNCHVCLGNTDYTKRCLYEGNVTWAGGQICTYRGGVSWEFSSQACILRYNETYDDEFSPGATYRNPIGNNMFIAQSAQAISVDNRLYHNAFMGKTKTQVKRYSTFASDDVTGFASGRNVWVDNIIAYPAKTPGSFPVFWQNDNSAPSDTMRGNLLFRYAPGDTVLEYCMHSVSTFYTLAMAKAYFPMVWDQSNFEASPLWRDSVSESGNRDFTLSSSSPCIDRAVPLTSTRQGTTSAKVIYIADASYFHYRWGASPYDRGDSIYVAGVRAELDSVDYDNNVLYTRDYITVPANAGVYVLATYLTVGGYQNRMQGPAPDVGPVESPSNIIIPSPTTQTNIISNPSFETGTDPWNTYSDGNVAFAEAGPGFNSPHAAQVNIVQKGSIAILYQAGRHIEQSTHYRLTFEAYSNSGHDLDVSMLKNQSPSINYGLDAVRCDLSNRWQNFSIDFSTPPFTGKEDDASFQFTFSPYADAGDQYFVDLVTLVKIGPATPGITQTQWTPKDYSLSQNYPNPFNPSTSIRYLLPGASRATLKVYDILGREVATLVNADQEKGEHVVTFETSGLSSGIYFYTLQAVGYTETKRMMLLK